MSGTKLKPCPFCGCSRIKQYQPQDYYSCMSCAAEGPTPDDIDGAETPAEAWNRRVSDE